MLGPVQGVKRRRYKKNHVIKPDIVVLKIWKQDIVKQKLCNWLITLAKQNLFISDLLFFFRWGGTLSQLVKSIERPSMFFILQTQHIIYKTTL